LAIPILGGSAAYAVGEMFRWPVSLEKQLRKAPGFYAVLALASVLGGLFNLLHIHPIAALYWTAVLNGVIAVPVIAVMMHMSSNRKVMGSFVISPYLKIMGWMCGLLMLAATVGMGITWGLARG
jgi:Mn2+/Fe2+ NRAMP family transporter